ncbi:MAG TPA: hypothetical protein VK642_09445 [Burkholderiales bacterium]|nr:hypothetical protein [Burkholderiales bacterium]
MNRNQIESNWRPLPKVHWRRWNELTDDELDVIDDTYDQWVTLSRNHDIVKEKAKRHATDWKH